MEFLLFLDMDVEVIDFCLYRIIFIIVFMCKSYGILFIILGIEVIDFLVLVFFFGVYYGILYIYFF